MQPVGEDEDLPPPYRSSESSVTEKPRWGDMYEDDDMDFDYTKKPPSSDPPRRPGGDPPGPPGGGPSGPPGGRPPSGPPGGGPLGGGGPPGQSRTGGGPPGGPPGDPNDPPGDGDPDATRRWIVYLRRRVQFLEREVDTGKGEMTRIARVAARAQRELDIAKIEMVKSANVASATQRQLDIARAETRQLNKVISGPAAESGRAGSPWERRQRPPTPGVWLVRRRLGTRTRSSQTPGPRRSPQESSQRQCPLSQRPLSPQRGPPQRARAARQWQ